MNSVVFVACVFVIAACNVQGQDRSARSEEFKKVMEQCKTEAGATDDDIKTLIMRQKMTTKTGWCLIGCIKKKTGVMDASNKLDLNKMKEQMSAMQAANSDMFSKFCALMEQCKSQAEADPKNLADHCVAAEALGQCFHSKKAAAGIP